MPIPKYDPNQTHQPQIQTEYFEHPEEGYLEYQPSTMRILGRGPGTAPIKQPIKLPVEFQGVPQPNVPTCSEPSATNAGCNKWAGCPFKALPFVGPGQVIMKQRGSVSHAHCYDYYETIGINGRPITSRHYGMEGWKIDTSRTTIPVKGHIPITNPLGEKIGVRTEIWQKEIPDLLPPWWPMMKKKGLPLPPAAKQYPELVETEDECGNGGGSEQAQSPPRASRNGRRKRTASTSRRKRSGTASGNAVSDSEPSA